MAFHGILYCGAHQGSVLLANRLKKIRIVIEGFEGKR